MSTSSESSGNSGDENETQTGAQSNQTQMHADSNTYSELKDCAWKQWTSGDHEKSRELFSKAGSFSFSEAMAAGGLKRLQEKAGKKENTD